MYDGKKIVEVCFFKSFCQKFCKNLVVRSYVVIFYAESKLRYKAGLLAGFNESILYFLFFMTQKSVCG